LLQNRDFTSNPNLVENRSFFHTGLTEPGRQILLPHVTTIKGVDI